MAKKILLDNIDVPGLASFEVYKQLGGYSAVEKALKNLTPPIRLLARLPSRVYGVEVVLVSQQG